MEEVYLTRAINLSFRLRREGGVELAGVVFKRFLAYKKLRGRKMTQIRKGLLLVWLLMLSCQVVEGVEEDRSVVEAALNDFAARQLPDDRKAVILIAKNTNKTWKRTPVQGCEASPPAWESLFDGEKYYEDLENTDCSFSESLENIFIEKNKNSSDATKLFRNAKKWHVALPEQEKLRSMELFYARMEDGRSISTKVILTRPAYNEQGDRAYVAFDFTSDHGASVHYLLSRKKGVWQVTCAKWMYYA